MIVTYHEHGHMQKSQEFLQVIDTINLLLDIVEFDANGRSSRRYVFEGCSCRKLQGLR